MAKKRLLILGGGFAGLDVARSVGRSRAARDYWDTLLVDKENFFQFNPLLPAVAVGSVETRHIVYPLREMARHRRIRFHKNKAMKIDLARREVHLHNNIVEPFDTLVIAIGSVTNYYGVPGAEENTRPFKTIVDAMALRARVVELFEMAEQAGSQAQRRRLLTIAIVGGGVTGVEVAAEVIEMARETLLPRYPSLRVDDLSITVFEGGDRVVPTARREHSAYVHSYLERRGVRVHLNSRVERVDPKCLYLAGGRRVDAFTIVWTAGVHPPAIVRELPLAHGSGDRVLVDRYLHPLDTGRQPIESTYVVGDCAAAPTADGKYQAALAQTAIDMGSYVGDALIRQAEGRAAAPYRYKESGYIISLGKHSSVLDLFGIPLSGKLAWLIWAGAYLIKMVGFRKQLEVGVDHVTHLFFEHDTSQIMNRRQILSDEELNLSLAAGVEEEPKGEERVVS
jgi:NADH:quinone reductase (non-electrogenic)